MNEELRGAIKTIAPFARSVTKIADNLDTFEVMEEHFIALEKRLEQAKNDFEKISKATEAAIKREQEAKMNINTSEKAVQDAVAAANKEIAGMRSGAQIEIDKMFKKAKGEYDEYLRTLEEHKVNAGEELRKLEALIEQRKKDHKTIEDSLKSIRSRIDA